MTLGLTQLDNALAVHFRPEPFSKIAHRELEAYPLSTPGICFNPSCSCSFDMSRNWSLYCSDACRKVGDAEMRRIGHKAAPALLAWRMGKYEKEDEALRALSRAGRNYVARLQGEWYRDRMDRVQRSGWSR
ncbi:hypothetical protein FHS89_001805 [Rubricella aquisinus]|uniref:Uncharacterized protein n=1 Tax=Rubricella aquisinus TaxID=2028108 RepID=A0A840X1L8_9RHOB|nr:hypothetical protein [Rubricella aquisinus]